MTRYVAATSERWVSYGGGRKFTTIQAAQKHVEFVKRAARRGLTEFAGKVKVFKLSIAEAR